MHSPLLPTPTEAALFAIYPVTLVLGSLFSHLSPSLRAPFNKSTYSPAHQSFQPPDLAPSYWATKRNAFNVYFVKLGWFWCTLALLLFTALAARGRKAIDIGLRPGSSSPAKRREGPARHTRQADAGAQDESAARTRRAGQVALRYALATGAWAFATQWFFGASLTDRFFRLTGGVCRHAAPSTLDEPALRKVVDAASGAACRAARGHWAGGLDVSGHVFLLMLGSGMLAFEALPLVLPWVRGLAGGRVVRTAAGDTVLCAALPDAPAEYDEGSEGVVSNGSSGEASEGTALRRYGVSAVLFFVVLAWWMLLMTAAFFHTWVEKSLACAFAGATLWSVYVAPRGSAGARAWIGMPGV